MFLLTSKIYDQSKEIEELQLAGWKYRALRATLPANNANVIWLERNVWAGNEDGIHQCQQLRGFHPSSLSDDTRCRYARQYRMPDDTTVAGHQEEIEMTPM